MISSPLHFKISLQVFGYTVSFGIMRAAFAQSNTSSCSTLTYKFISLLNNSKSVSHIHQIQTQLIIHNLYLDPQISHTFTTTFYYYHLHNAQNKKTHVFSSDNTPNRPLSHTQYSENSLSFNTNMNRNSIGSDYYNFPFALKELTGRWDVKKAQSLHTQIVKLGQIDDVHVGNSLMSFYVSCGDMGFCRKVFDDMPEKDVVSWTLLMTGYRDLGDLDNAVVVFEQTPHSELIEEKMEKVELNQKKIQNVELIEKNMLNMGLEPNQGTVSESTMRQPIPQPESFTERLIFLIKKCTSLSHVDQIQAQLIIHDLYLNTGIAHSFITVCQSLNYLHTAYLLYAQSHCVFICNNLIRALSHAQYSEKALSFYAEMKRNSIDSNHYTFPFVFKALADLRDIINGQSLHTHVMKLGHIDDVYVRNSMLSLYASCQDMGLCWKLFNETPVRDVVSWTVMITGYRESHDFDNALFMFDQMLHAGVEPNRVTMVNALAACSGCGALKIGVWIHNYVKKKGWEIDVKLGSSLIDMYGKCGRINDGLVVFENMGKKGEYTWNTLIKGLALAKYGREAIRFFSEMEFEGVNPDEVTLTVVLSACSHNGFLQTGKQIFASLLVGRYNFSATKKHYACIVDLVARSGYLEEALRIINRLPIEPTITMWGALLTACRAHGNLELARFCAWKAIELEPKNGAFYAVLSNAYAQMGKWSDVEKVRSLMRERGFNKDLGSSLVYSEAQDVVNELLA